MGKLYEHYSCRECNNISRFRCERCGRQFCEHHSYHTADTSGGYPITLCEKCLKKRTKFRIIRHLSVLGLVSLLIILIVI
jgi:hypothetical protein